MQTTKGGSYFLISIRYFVPLTLSLGLVGIALTFLVPIFGCHYKIMEKSANYGYIKCILEESIRDSFLKSLSNAHLANLLDPKNEEIEEHYLSLLFEDNPQKAIQERFSRNKSQGYNHKFYLTALGEICAFLEATKAEKTHLHEVFKVGNEYSTKLFGNINKSNSEETTDQITKFYLLTGNSSMAENLIQKSMERKIYLPKLFLMRHNLHTRKSH